MLTEQDWIKGNFGDPKKPIVVTLDYPIMTVDTSIPFRVLVRNFTPTSGPTLFKSGLWIYTQQAKAYQSAMPLEGLDDNKLAEFGKVIGQNSCEQNLYRVDNREAFWAEAEFGRWQDIRDLVIFVVPDQQTLISCLSTDGNSGCSTVHRYQELIFRLVIPATSVCSWPTIRRQLHQANNSGLMPQTFRSPNIRNKTNAK